MATTTDIELSEEQRAIVNRDDHALVVIASAGTGKTEVVAQYVERVLEERADGSSRVLALSYTNKASNELRERFDRRLGAVSKRVDTETLHAFAHGLLRRSGTWIGLPAEPEILTRDEDRVELLAQWLSERGELSAHDDLRAALRAADLARARCEDLPPIGIAWQRAMEAQGVLDHEGTLERAAELLELPSARKRLGRLYTHMVVDEAQNLTPSQYRVLSAVLGPPPLASMRVMLVGDDKQSLIRFAGANWRLMKHFADEYGAQIYHLSRNYRSAKRIVELGDAVAVQLGHQVSDPDVDYAARGSVHIHHCADEAAEGRYVCGWVKTLLDEGLDRSILAPGEATEMRMSDIAVLGRSSAALRSTHLSLDEFGIETTTSVNLDTLLTTDLGRAVVEVIGMRAANHIAPRWQLGRLLKVDASATSDLSSLRSHVKTRTDVYAGLSSLMDLDEPADVPKVLDDLGPTADEQWHGDRLQIQDAWHRFALTTDVAARSWGAFRLFLNRLQRSDDVAKGVRLLTIAKAQGREYRAVAVVGMNDGQLPDFRASTQDERREELSNFYVAVSRPSRTLLLTRPQSRATRYGPRAQTPSPYLALVTPLADPS